MLNEADLTVEGVVVQTIGFGALVPGSRGLRLKSK